MSKSPRGGLPRITPVSCSGWPMSVIPRRRKSDWCRITSILIAWQICTWSFHPLSHIIRLRFVDNHFGKAQHILTATIPATLLSQNNLRGFARIVVRFDRNMAIWIER